MRRGLLLGLLAASVLIAPARAGAIALDPVDDFTAPIHVAAPPGDPRLFVVERGGTIKVVKNGVTLGANFLDISDFTTTEGERGLLSMAFDPNYATNGLFYVFYTSDGVDPPGGAAGDIVVDEYKVSTDPDIADEASRRRVMLIPRGTGASNHYGGQLQFGGDGLLYISIGEAADTARAQSIASLHGKILRIDPHGAGVDQYSIPAANPFVGVPGAEEEIWALGLRNPFRFSFDRLTGAILIGDVGGGAREEVDLGFSGANFGWPCREGFIAGPGLPSCPGPYTDPIFDYPNANVLLCGSAIIGGFVYRGSDIPGLAGRYLYADLCVKQVRSLLPTAPATGDRSEGVSTTGNVFSFGEDSRCELYVAAPPTVYKIVASPGATPGSGGCNTPAAAPPPGFSPPVVATKKKKKCKQKKKRKRKKCRRKRRRR